MKSVDPGESARGLLFGLLALQNHFIDRQALLAAFDVWMGDKSRPFGEILVEQEAITGDLRALLDSLVHVHLAKHDDQPEKSLAALTPLKSVRKDLEALADAASLASLSYLSTELNDLDPFETKAYSVGEPTTAGVRFKILRPLNKGGMGVVSVALDTELDRSIALKEIRDTAADNRDYRARFLAEAEITGKLEHPGIIPIYGLGSYGDGRPFYAMRLIRGDKTGSLMEAIDRFHNDSQATTRVVEFRGLLRRFLDVCNALAYAHSKGVLHRDLKPENILLGPYGETLVVDWGLAKAAGRPDLAAASDGDHVRLNLSGSDLSPTMAGGAMGTPGYAPPEQMVGDLENVGNRSDVYGLGAVLYCLTTGQAPFSRREVDLGTLIKKIEAGAFPKPRQVREQIDKPLEAICLKAMSRKPIDRYPSVQALADDVERYLADEPVTVWREPWSVRTRRWTRKHRTAVAALAVSLATAVVLLIISNILVNNERRATARALVRVGEEQLRTAEALQHADSNFQSARRAVEDYFTTVSEEVLLDEPGMQPLRQKLLRSALGYHKAFLADRQGDARLEAELARSHYLYGQIASINNQSVESLDHYRRAMAGFEALTRRFPESRIYRRNLAWTIQDHAHAIALQGKQRDEAILGFRQAIRAFEPLVVEDPADTNAREGLTVSLADLAYGLLSRRDGRDEGVRLLDQSRVELEKLIADRPESLRFRLKLAELHANFYNTYVGSRERQNEALKESQAALKLYQDLSDRVPNSPRFRYRLGVLHSSRAMIYMRLQRPADALVESQKARKLLLEVARGNPENASYQGYLANSCLQIGNALATSGDNEGALDPLRESCEGFDRYFTLKPDDQDHQRQYLGTLSVLGGALHHLDKFDEAVTVLQKAVKVGGDLCRREPENIFSRGDYMGCQFNLAITLNRDNRHEEAVRAFQDFRATASGNPDNSPENHARIDSVGEELPEAFSLREVGRNQDAQKIIDRIRTATATDDLENAYEWARYESRGAALLDRAHGDRPTIEACKTRALKHLARIKFNARDVPKLQRDPVFEALQDRPEFRLILLDAAFPEAPFRESR